MKKTPSATGWPTAILIVLLAILFYGLVAHATTLWDRDEPRFARATVEMLRSGNWLVPTFNGLLRPDKPILIYWLMALFIKMLGATALGARTISVLAVAGAMLCTYWIGKRIMDSRMGIMAMIVLGTTPLVLAEGTLATADATLLFWITASMAVIGSWYLPIAPGSSENQQKTSTKQATGHALLLGITTGGAQLTKGPVGLAIPLIALVLMFALERWPQKKGSEAFVPEKTPAEKAFDPFVRGWRLWMIVLASAMGIAFFLLWAIPANDAVHGQLLKLGFERHVVARSVRALEGHGGNWFLMLPFYLPVIILGFFPWTLFLLGALAVAWQQVRAGSRAMIFLAGWALAGFLLMTCVSTKLPHYVLPIWPAMALMVAWSLRWVEENKLSDWQQKLMRRSSLFFGPVAVAGILAFGMGPWIVKQSISLRLPGAVVAAVVVGFLILALRAHHAYRFMNAAKIAAAGMVLLMLSLGLFFLPAVESLKPMPKLAGELRAQMRGESPVLCVGFFEPSLVYYLNQGNVDSPTLPQLTQWASEGKPGYLVAPANMLEKLRTRVDLSHTKIVASVGGLNYSTGKWFTLVALENVKHPQEDSR